MEHKPITKKQMCWQIAGQVLTAVLTGIGLWLGRSVVERILAGVVLACSVGTVIYTIWLWKKHPLVDEEADREFMEDKKSSFTAFGGSTPHSFCHRLFHHHGHQGLLIVTTF